jgi:hypothetical protein
VRVALTRNLLAQRHDRLDLAQIDQHRTAVAALLHHAGDNVAFDTGEVSILLLVFGIAKPLHDHLACRRCGNPPEAHRCVVILADLLSVLVELRRHDRHMPSLAIEVDAGTVNGTLGLLVRSEQRILNRARQDFERQVLLALHQSQHGDVDIHLIPPRPRCAPLWAG